MLPPSPFSFFCNAIILSDNPKHRTIIWRM